VTDSYTGKVSAEVTEEDGPGLSTKWRIKVDDTWFSKFQGEKPCEKGDKVRLEYKTADEEKVITELETLESPEEDSEEWGMSFSLCLKVAGGILGSVYHGSETAPEAQAVAEYAEELKREVEDLEV